LVFFGASIFTLNRDNTKSDAKIFLDALFVNLNALKSGLIDKKNILLALCPDFNHQPHQPKTNHNLDKKQFLIFRTTSRTWVIEILFCQAEYKILYFK